MLWEFQVRGFGCVGFGKQFPFYVNRGIRPADFFWRDHSGHEVGLIIEDGPAIRAIEIKSSETVNPQFFDGIRWFCGQTGLSPENCTLVYGGTEEYAYSAGQVFPWKRAGCL